MKAITQLVCTKCGTTYSGGNKSKLSPKCRTIQCKICQKSFQVGTYRVAEAMYCSRSCQLRGYMKDHPEMQQNIRHPRGLDHHRWQGGRGLHSSGYVVIKHQGKYVFEHRLVMSQHIGRPLKREEQVHHIDGNKKNNSLDNLLLLPSAKAHRLHHMREDVGTTRLCRKCGIGFRSHTQTSHYCEACKAFSCENCGKAKTLKKYQPNKRTYCSLKCRNQANVIRFTLHNPRKKAA